MTDSSKQELSISSKDKLVVFEDKQIRRVLCTKVSGISQLLISWRVLCRKLPIHDVIGPILKYNLLKMRALFSCTAKSYN